MGEVRNFYFITSTKNRKTNWKSKLHFFNHKGFQLKSKFAIELNSLVKKTDAFPFFPANKHLKKIF